MSNEIATYSMIYNKLNLGSTGSECPTKTLILAINSSIVISNAPSYGDNECVRIDDINKVGTDNYTFYTDPQTVTLSGGVVCAAITTYSSKLLDDGTMSAYIGYTVTSRPDWVSINDSGAGESGWSSSLGGYHSQQVCSNSANTSTSQREGDIVLTQNESGKTWTIHVIQSINADLGQYRFLLNTKAFEGSKWISSGMMIGIPSNFLGYGVPYAYTRIESFCDFRGLGLNFDELNYYVNFSAISYPDWVRVVVDNNPKDIRDDYNWSYMGRIIVIPESYDGSSPRNGELIILQYTSKDEMKFGIELGGEFGNPHVNNFTFTWGDSTKADLYLNIPLGGINNYTTEVISTWKISGSSTEKVKYTIVSTVDWIDVTSADDNPVINVAASDSAREGVIVLIQKDSNKSLQINITQNDSDPYTFEWKGNPDLKENAILFNADYTTTNAYQIVSTYNDHIILFQVESKPDWVTVYGTATDGNAGDLKVSVSGNTYNERYGTVVFKQVNSNKTLSLNIVQLAKEEGNPDDHSDYHFYDDSGDSEFDFNFAANDTYRKVNLITSYKDDPAGTNAHVAVDFNTCYDYTDDKPSWISYIGNNGYSPIPYPSYTTEIRLEKNTSQYSRSCYVVFIQLLSGKKIISRIIQHGATSDNSGYLFVWEDTATTEDKIINMNIGESLYDKDVARVVCDGALDLTATWTATSDTSGITPTIKEDRSFSNKTLQLDIDSSTSPRTGTVTLTQADSNKTLRVIVKQQ